MDFFHCYILNYSLALPRRTSTNEQENRTRQGWTLTRGLHRSARCCKSGKRIVNGNKLDKGGYVATIILFVNAREIAREACRPYVRDHDCIRYRLWRAYRTDRRMPVIAIIIGHFAWPFSRVHWHFDVNAGIEKQKSDTLGSVSLPPTPLVEAGVNEILTRLWKESFRSEYLFYYVAVDLRVDLKWKWKFDRIISIGNY